MDTAALDDELITALRTRGQRVTLPRLLVHRHVKQGDRHLTPEQIHGELATELPSLSQATVYGTLDLLAELGLVRRVATPRGMTTYDSRVEDHQHAICRACGRVEDVDAGAGATRAIAAAEAAGFKVAHAQLTLSGLCAVCAAAGRS